MKDKVAKNRIILLGIGVLVLYWILESFMMVFVFREGNLIQQLFAPGLHDLWMRSISVCIFIFFAVYLQSAITRRTQLDDELKIKAQLLDDATDAITVHDFDGNLIYLNEATYKSHGYSKDELMRLGIYALVPPEDTASFKIRLTKLREKGKATFETTGIRKDGSALPVEIHARIVKSGGKELVLNVIRDITERKQKEHDIGKRIKELQCLYGISKIVDKPDVTLDKLYQEVANMLPPSWQYPENTCARIILDGKEYRTANFAVTQWKQSSNLLVRNKRIGTIEVFYLEEKPKMHEGPFLREERDLINGIARMVSETIERKQTEQELKIKARLLDDATDAITVHDFDGNYIYLNEAAYKSRGYSKSELMRLGLHAILTPENARLLKARLAKVREQGKATFESAHLHKDGSAIPVEIHARTIERDNMKYVLSIARNIAERKRMEEILRNKNEQLVERTQEAEKANQAKSEFLAKMSHDLRTPLNAIIGFSELLSDEVPGKINEEQKQCLYDILNGGKILLTLTEDVLDLSRIEAGKIDLNFRSITLSEVTTSIYDTTKTILASKKQRLDIRVPEDFPHVYADETRIRQVLLNLVSNSIKFTPERGEIRIEAEIIDGDWCHVSVIDNGIGIKKEDQEHLFEAFYQVKGAVPQTEHGTGLGLAIVKQLVEQHGGQIWVESEYGKGSKFTFTLSLVPEAKTHLDEKKPEKVLSSTKK